MRARDLPSESKLVCARRELAAAEHVERLQIENWCTLLSYRPALPTICSELSSFMAVPEQLGALLDAGEPPASFVHAAALQRLSMVIRELDLTREALAHVDRCVQAALAEDREAVEYLSQLRAARLAARQAKNQIVVANLGLVRTLARRYTRSSAPMPELVQEGSIALLRAVELFDYRRGLRFSTYAVWWIRNAFQRCISEQASAVRAPLGALRCVGQTNRFLWAHYGTTGEMPSDEQVAEHLGGTASTMERAARGGGTRTISLDASVEDEGGRAYLRHLVDQTPSVEARVSEAGLYRRLELSLAKLPALESKILIRRFGLHDGLETPLSVIAREHALSYERVLQLSRQALRRLRAELEHAGIESMH